MTQVGTVYGQALYELCCSEGCEESVLQELAVLDESFSKTPEFLRLLASPNLTKPERCTIVDDSFRGRVHPYVLNFLKILTEKGYSRHFSSCFREYQARYDEDHGILPVTAVSAVALSYEQQERLTEKLQKRTGKTVRLTVQLDEKCLGGLRLEYAGQQLDGTLEHRLRSLKDHLNTEV